MKRTSRNGSALALLLAASVLQACSGSGGSAAPGPAATPAATATATATVTPTASPTASPPATPTPAGTASPLALLVPGTTNRYGGTERQTITFASPSSTQPDSSAAYTLAETDTVSVAPSGAPAPFDLHRVIDYTVTASASYGIAPATDTIDDYENVATLPSGAEVITLAETAATLTGTNVSSVLANGGSGAYAQAATGSYSPSQVVASYPLTTGAEFAASLTHNEVENETTAAASGTLMQSLTTAFEGDDSFSAGGMLTDTDTTSETEDSDGAAYVVDEGPKPLTEFIARPVKTNGSYGIPITLNGTSSTIADYYPGNAAPPSPLGKQSVKVVGPASSLPAGCPAAGTYPNVIEVDTSLTALDVIAGSYTTSTIRRFDSNGLIVCRLANETAKVYSLETGDLEQTTETVTTLALTSSTASSRARLTNGKNFGRRVRAGT